MRGAITVETFDVVKIKPSHVVPPNPAVGFAGTWVTHALVFNPTGANLPLMANAHQYENGPLTPSVRVHKYARNPIGNPRVWFFLVPFFLSILCYATLLSLLTLLGLRWHVPAVFWPVLTCRLPIRVLGRHLYRLWHLHANRSVPAVHHHYQSECHVAAPSRIRAAGCLDERFVIVILVYLSCS
jgi:hypothetical protein